jgi:iron-sulfur cluster repair protein YtfE (RIC family)
MSSELRSMLHESVEEHLGIKRHLADLITMRLDDVHFKAKLKVLKEYVSHHAHKEEEQKMFPLLKKMMSGDQLAAIGNEVLVMYEELIASSPSRDVPKQTTQAASLPPV